MDDFQLVKEAGKAMDRSEISRETSGRADGPRIEGCSIQEESPCNKAVDLELRNPEKETSASSRPVAVSVSPPAPLQQCPLIVSATDMTCLICFHQFSLARPPKVLACQHAFCATCLQMILRQEDRTWIVSCPLCRKATVVFGGLVCSLGNLQHVTERLGPPDPEADIAGTLWHSQQPPSSEMQSRDLDEVNQAAIKRLILLLLLVSVLIVFILPFTEIGLLTWFLCCVVVLGAIICAVLCWDPSWSCPSFSLPLWTKKVTQGA